MFSVAARDGVDSIGRTVSEYKRDPHGGRERLIEEILTFAIWGFGVRTMKQLYDAAILHTPGVKDKLGIHLPDLDLALLPKGRFGFEQGAQILDKGLVEKFHNTFGGVEQYKQLLDVVADKSIQNKYRYSSIVKFGMATMVPALIIALGIPTFNQWLTRKKLAKEHPKARTSKEPVNAAKRSTPLGPQSLKSIGNQPTTGFASVPTFMPMMGSARPQMMVPQAFRPMGAVVGPYAKPFQYNSVATSPWMSGSPMGNQAVPGFPSMPMGSPMPIGMPVNPWASAPSSNVLFSGELQNEQSVPSNTAHSATPHHAKGVRFGSGISYLSDAASEVLQHERWTTLFLDGTISSGRVYKARNTTERMEIAFRETAIIAFLYWMQRPIQDFVGRRLGKLLNIPSDLEFRTIQHLYKQNHKLDITRFKHDFHKDIAALNLNWEALEHPKADHKDLIERVYKYFLEERKPGSPNNNILLEAAIDGGWIPTFNEKSVDKKTAGDVIKGILHDINPVKAQQLTENQYLDLTKKIDTHAIVSLKKHMEQLGQSVEKVGSKSLQELEPLLKRVMRLRGGAWLFSNAICFTVLSVIIPGLQHEITRRTTGKNYFPGVEAAK
jgi:hypothetical protein